MRTVASYNSALLMKSLSWLRRRGVGEGECKKTVRIPVDEPTRVPAACLVCGQKYPGPGYLPPGPGLGCSCLLKGAPGWRSRGWLSAGSAEFRRISSQFTPHALSPPQDPSLT